jgi:hypothetical protein
MDLKEKQDMLTKALDMDEWRHSWHMNINNALYCCNKEHYDAKKVLAEKVNDRLADIEFLRGTVKMLEDNNAE